MITFSSSNGRSIVSTYVGERLLMDPIMLSIASAQADGHELAKALRMLGRPALPNARAVGYIFGDEARFVAANW